MLAEEGTRRVPERASILWSKLWWGTEIAELLTVGWGIELEKQGKKFGGVQAMLPFCAYLMTLSILAMILQVDQKITQFR